MKRMCSGGMATCLAIVVLCNTTWAEDTDDRLSASLGVGVLFIDGSDNLEPGESFKTIENLNNSPERETSFLPIPMMSMAYRLSDSGETSLFLNTDPPEDEGDIMGFNFGITHSADEIGKLEFSALLLPFTDVYKDPYLVNIQREISSVLKYGVKMSINQIVGSGLGVEATWIQKDVDADQLGELHPTMARDGNVFCVNTNYNINFYDILEIHPGVTFRKGDLKGEANSYGEVKPSIEISSTIGPLILASELSFKTSEYDKRSPIFNKTREDKEFGVNLTMYYIAPFGFEHYSVGGLIGYNQADSNINFYDTEAVYSAVLMSYAF